MHKKPTKKPAGSRKRKSMRNANDDKSGLDLRAEKLEQRILEVRWAIERIIEEGFDTKGVPLLKYDDLVDELRAEFPDTLTSNTAACKRATAARRAATAIFDSQKDLLKAITFDRLEALFAEGIEAMDLEFCRKVISDLVSDFGLAAPTKSEVDLGEATRAAILGQYAVEISDEALDEACDVSE